MQTQQLLDLPQREPEFLGAFDETQPPRGLRRIGAVARGAPLRLGQ